MDFRLCPACKQSVLDDDAEDCPFCGASMSGKPGATTKSAATKPAAAGSKTAPSESSSSGKTAKSSKAVGTPTNANQAKPSTRKVDDDPDGDPFAIESEAKKKYFKMRVSAAPGCRHQVKCPMCGVEGFVPEKLGGKEVKCRDSECMVPVFTAPMPEKKEVVEEKPKGLSAGAITGISIAGLAVFAGIVYYIMFSGPEIKIPQGPDDIVDDTTSNDKKNDIKTVDNPLANGVGKAAASQQIKLEEIRKEIFDGDSPLVVVIAQDRKNQRKLESRQLAALVFASMGDEERMKQQLDRLTSLGQSQNFTATFMKTLPLAELGWFHLQKNNTVQAQKTFDEAWEVAQDLPKSGDSTVFATIELAALANALGKVAEARQLVQKYESAETSQRIAANLAVITANESFDYNRESKIAALTKSQFPLSSAVARVLVARGLTAESISWCQGFTNEDQRTESLAALAVASAIRTAQLPKNDWKKTITTMATKSDLINGYISARLAVAFAVTNQTDNATAAIKMSQDALAKTGEGASAGIPTMSSIHGGSRLVPEATVLAAKAHAELAHAYFQLNNAEEGWRTAKSAADLAQKSLPAVRTVKSMTRQLTNDKAGVDRQLRNTLNLSNDNQIRIEFSKYRTNLVQLETKIDALIQLQTDVLQLAAENGQQETVWATVKDRDSDSADGWAPLLESEFAGTLRSIFRESNNEETIKALEAQMGRRRIKGPDASWLASRQARRLALDGQISDANSVIRKAQLEPSDAHKLIMKIGSELAVAGEVVQAGKWCILQKDTLSKESTLRLVSGIAVKQKEAGKLWKEIRTSGVSAMETGMVCLGIAQAIDW